MVANVRMERFWAAPVWTNGGYSKFTQPCWNNKKYHQV